MLQAPHELAFDLLEAFFHNGTIWECGNPALKVDAPEHNRELLFLLNFMSRYHDLPLHGLLDGYCPEEDVAYLLAMGCVGPFGRITRQTEKETPKVFQ